MANNGIMVLCLVLVCTAVIAPYADAITCGQVASRLVPCNNYLTTDAALSPTCCNGIQGLNNAATTTLDRQTACGCLKELYTSTPNVNLQKASSLPGQCGVNIAYQISPSTDCSQVQ